MLSRNDLSNVRKVAVLGAGTMGPGIAATFVSSGIATSLWARRGAAAVRGAEDAETRRDLLVEHGLTSPNDLRVEPTDDLSRALSGAQVVIEAISEDERAKGALLSEVESHIERDVLLASTTSGLDIDRIAKDASHPGRYVVMHFWNPAHLIALVEVLGGPRTEPRTVDLACSLVRRVGKHPVRLARFVPGFLGARLQQAVVREAVALLEAGVASAEDIDATTRLSFGARFPVIGPLETSDLGGLDVVAAIHEYLLADLDCSHEPQSALRELVEAGDLGSKTGRGFYDWRARDADELTRRRDEELISRLKWLRDQGGLSSG